MSFAAEATAARMAASRGAASTAARGAAARGASTKAAQIAATIRERATLQRQATLAGKSRAARAFAVEAEREGAAVSRATEKLLKKGQQLRSGRQVVSNSTLKEFRQAKGQNQIETVRRTVNFTRNGSAFAEPRGPLSAPISGPQEQALPFPMGEEVGEAKNAQFNRIVDSLSSGYERADTVKLVEHPEFQDMYKKLQALDELSERERTMYEWLKDDSGEFLTKDMDEIFNKPVPQVTQAEINEAMSRSERAILEQDKLRRAVGGTESARPPGASPVTGVGSTPFVDNPQSVVERLEPSNGGYARKIAELKPAGAQEGYQKKVADIGGTTPDVEVKRKLDFNTGGAMTPPQRPFEDPYAAARAEARAAEAKAQGPGMRARMSDFSDEKGNPRLRWRGMNDTAEDIKMKRDLDRGLPGLYEKATERYPGKPLVAVSTRTGVAWLPEEKVPLPPSFREKLVDGIVRAANSSGRFVKRFTPANVNRFIGQFPGGESGLRNVIGRFVRGSGRLLYENRKITASLLTTVLVTWFTQQQTDAEEEADRQATAIAEAPASEGTPQETSGIERVGENALNYADAVADPISATKETLKAIPGLESIIRGSSNIQNVRKIANEVKRRQLEEKMQNVVSNMPKKDADTILGELNALLDEAAEVNDQGNSEFEGTRAGGFLEGSTRRMMMTHNQFGARDPILVKSQPGFPRMSMSMDEFMYRKELTDNNPGRQLDGDKLLTERQNDGRASQLRTKIPSDEAVLHADPSHPDRAYDDFTNTENYIRTGVSTLGLMGLGSVFRAPKISNKEPLTEYWTDTQLRKDTRMTEAIAPLDYDTRQNMAVPASTDAFTGVEWAPYTPSQPMAPGHLSASTEVVGIGFDENTLSLEEQPRGEAKPPLKRQAEPNDANVQEIPRATGVAENRGETIRFPRRLNDELNAANAMNPQFGKRAKTSSVFEDPLPSGIMSNRQ